MKRNLIVCAVAAAIIAMSAMLCSPAAADMSQTYDLKIFNNPAAALNPDLHYTVEVSDRDVLSGQARFTISNISTGGTSSIAEIYFDDGFLLDISRVDNGPGVSFAPDLSSAGNDVRPKNLPAGQDLHPPFVTSVHEWTESQTIAIWHSKPKPGYWEYKTTNTLYQAYFAADADNPSPLWGVNNNEYCDIVFNLLSGATVADAIAAMNTGATATQQMPNMLRVGVHIQNVTADGESASAVSVIPAPAAIGLGLIGLGLIGWLKRRMA